MQVPASSSRRFAVLLALCFAASVAGAASTYKVNLTTELNGLDVKVETVENSGGLVVRLTNATAAKVKCTLKLDAQPQPLSRKTVYVEAGRTEDAPFVAKRKWFDVGLFVECKAAGD